MSSITEIEVKFMNIKYTIMKYYIEMRILSEKANFIYRNTTGGEDIMSDTEYDMLIKRIENVEKEFPELMEFVDTFFGKDSLTNRVG